MGRKSNRKKERRHSSIDQHKKNGKMLTPPFLQMEGLKKLSWKDDRLPSYLWIGLILNYNDRSTGLRHIQHICRYFFDRSEELGPNDLSFEAITEMTDENLEEFYDFIFKGMGLTEELKPLLLFDNLPKRSLLEKHLNIENTEVEVGKLYHCVANMLDQQSQLSTDCRWARLFYLMTRRQSHQFGPLNKVIFYYPNFAGDEMHLAGSQIRSCDNAMSMMVDPGDIQSGWVENFWDEALNNFPCWELDILTEDEENLRRLTVQNIDEVEGAVKEHFYASMSTTAIDPKHEASFAFTLYILDVLKEISESGTQNGITGRLGLRTIAECYITLSYLNKKNDHELWQSYRIYGAGQAKLAFLKIEDLESQPQFIALRTLEALANEDQWQEFSEINLGHWEKSNLRKMSEDAGVKDIYNSYYDWTSGFAHGQWASLRNVEFTVCGNPLHRLHRIPTKNKILPTVVPDAVELCNRTISILTDLYPTDRIPLVELQIK